MGSRTTKALLDIWGFVGIAWLWIAVYESFTHTGLWRIIDDAIGGAATLPSQAAVLATCVLVGWLSLAIVGWVTWVVLRGRLGPDFPSARVRR